MIDVACSYFPTFNGTLSAAWFFGKPVPSDRLPCWRFTPRAPWRLCSAPGVMPPIKIKSESKVVMRHGQSPRYADVPYAWLTNSASLSLPLRRCWVIPLYSLLILGVESGNFGTPLNPTKIKFAT